MTVMAKQGLRARLLVATALLILGAGACSPAEQDAGSVGRTQSPPASIDGGGSSGSGYDDTYNFTATTFDGERFELADHKGTPVVINFWESW